MTDNFAVIVRNELTIMSVLALLSPRVKSKIITKNPSPGACTLKWCDGLRASMTPRAISVGVSHSW